MVGRGLRFSRNDRMVEVIKLFIIWHQQQNKANKRKLVSQACDRPVGIKGK